MEGHLLDGFLLWFLEEGGVGGAGFGVWCVSFHPQDTAAPQRPRPPENPLLFLGRRRETLCDNLDASVVHVFLDAANGFEGHFIEA